MKFVEEMRSESDVSPEKFFEIMMNHVYETAYLKGEYDERKRQEARSNKALPAKC